MTITTNGSELAVHELSNGLIRLEATRPVHVGPERNFRLELTLTDDDLRKFRDEANALLRKRSRRKNRNRP